jgi:N-acetylmuramoyl-L-alanine amidase
VSVSEGHNGLPEYALKSLLEKKGLIKGLWSEIPDGTRLIRLSIEDKIATVNFNNEFLQGLTNNHNVYLLVKSISNTLFQFDDINAMRILVEGKEPGIINDFDLNKVIINQPLEINISSEDAKRPDYIPDIPDPVIYLDAGHGGTEPGAVAQDGRKGYKFSNSFKS